MAATHTQIESNSSSGYSSDYIETVMSFEGHFRNQWMLQYKQSLWVPNFVIEDDPGFINPNTGKRHKFFEPRSAAGAKLFKKKEGCYRGGKDKRVHRSEFAPGTLYNIPVAVRKWDGNAVEQVRDWIEQHGLDKYVSRWGKIIGYINLPALCMSASHRSNTHGNLPASEAHLSLVFDPRYSFRVRGRLDISTVFFRHRKR